MPAVMLVVSTYEMTKPTQSLSPSMFFVLCCPVLALTTKTTLVSKSPPALTKSPATQYCQDFTLNTVRHFSLSISSLLMQHHSKLSTDRLLAESVEDLADVARLNSAA